MPELVPDVLGPVEKPPQRRPASVRRTSTVLMSWPDGIFEGLELSGRCRDLLTPEEGEPVVLAQDGMLARTSLDRTIVSIEASPPVENLDGLVGARAGGALRSSLADVVPDLRNAGAPLYLLLDDIAGASLIAGFAWLRWRDHLPEFPGLRERTRTRSMVGICSGFRPGASSLNSDGTLTTRPGFVMGVPPLADPDDPLGWHSLDDHPPMAMRRARRIDVWSEDGELRIDAMFRDSCWEPDGTEIAVHEYCVLASADPNGGTVTSVEAKPRVLPWVECPLAAGNVHKIVGVPLGDLRLEVLERIRSIDCCTHLNDALRSLAEVPVLASSLPHALAPTSEQRTRL
jgi:hypothetical protein